MRKQHLINTIEKEMKICRRLYTKIPPDKMNFRVKEGVRSILELLQYLTFIGTAMPEFWLKKDDKDFHTFFSAKGLAAKEVLPENFLSLMDEQIKSLHELLGSITDEDLSQREVTYPWGGSALFGEAIVDTSVKWLSAYKLQLFLFIKLATDQTLATPDAWVLTELD